MANVLAATIAGTSVLTTTLIVVAVGRNRRRQRGRHPGYERRSGFSSKIKTGHRGSPSARLLNAFLKVSSGGFRGSSGADYALETAAFASRLPWMNFQFTSG